MKVGWRNYQSCDHWPIRTEKSVKKAFQICARKQRKNMKKKQGRREKPCLSNYSSTSKLQLHFYDPEWQNLLIFQTTMNTVMIIVIVNPGKTGNWSEPVVFYKIGPSDYNKIDKIKEQRLLSKEKKIKEKRLLSKEKKKRDLLHFLILISIRVFFGDLWLEKK